jgi:NTP pyrophosphatase (non-canonical NTP hydrolase)
MMKRFEEFTDYINGNYPRPYSNDKRERAFHMADRLEAAMGLVGEAGEVSELFKKACFYGKHIDVGDLTKELGDVFHYFARVCYLNHVSINAIIQTHEEKMKARFPNGYSDEAAIARKDEVK